MNRKTCALIGATGLIGSNLLELLQNDDHFSSIKILARRPLECSDHKVRVIVLDFSDTEAFKSAISGSDVIFCAVGTTTKKVKGDKLAYRKVDFEIPVNAGKLCSETGGSHFLVVSSVGADSKSNNFYLKFKGEMEDSLKEMSIPSVSVFRPSMLLGKRQEFRPAERIAQVLSSFFSFAFPSKYKPVKARTVAESMIAASKREIAGFKIFHYKEIKDLQSGRG